MRLESRSQPPEAGGKQKSRNGHQEASIHEKTSYEAVKFEAKPIEQVSGRISKPMPIPPAPYPEYCRPSSIIAR